ncbi:DinB family protein [Chitinophaga flava]|uniref:DinB family protein n=1 Tax=Chitinophaga flava TaxID=2259036 RepID=A0A365XZP2_9BACT|nr:DinB family protein [Chitinophaga flava]RBL91803.1 DinB family protein [Chitinophaga flava]
MRQQLVQEVETTGSSLLQLLSSFSEEQINTRPFEGSWTAGQVAEHITKAGNCGIVYGNVAPSDRQPDEKVTAIKELFLNFDIQMQSPEMVLPTQDSHQKEALLQEVRQIWEKLVHAAQTVPLEDTCLDFELPGFGPFTRLEWIQFINIHTKRHIHQLEKIKARLQTA